MQSFVEFLKRKLKMWKIYRMTDTWTDWRWSTDDQKSSLYNHTVNYISMLKKMGGGELQELNYSVLLNHTCILIFLLSPLWLQCWQCVIFLSLDFESLFNSSFSFQPLILKNNDFSLLHSNSHIKTKWWIIRLLETLL